MPTTTENNGSTSAIAEKKAAKKNVAGKKNPLRKPPPEGNGGCSKVPCQCGGPPKVEKDQGDFKEENGGDKETGI